MFIGSIYYVSICYMSVSPFQFLHALADDTGLNIKRHGIVYMVNNAVSIGTIEACCVTLARLSLFLGQGSTSVFTRAFALWKSMRGLGVLQPSVGESRQPRDQPRP